MGILERFEVGGGFGHGFSKELSKHFFQA